MTQQEFLKRYTYNLREDKLGGGAFGTVYRAYDNVLDKTVAIKIAEVKTFGDKEFSLLDEFEAIRGLPEHQNIANYERVFTFEQPNGVFDYAIIQYYPHGNLSDIIKNEPLTQEQKEDIALQILDGLEFLHTHNVVHRDMKPSNILIHKRKNGRIIPKIADFGLSKQADTIAQSRFTNSFGGGTLEYSSPEQLRGQALRLNTDLWAWAVMTYELFTGIMLFAPDGSHSTGSAEREKELFEQILNKDVSQALSVLPNNWQNALSQCLERDANKRIKSTEEIKSLLKGNMPAPDTEATQITVKDEAKVLENKRKEKFIDNFKSDNPKKYQEILDYEKREIAKTKLKSDILSDRSWVRNRLLLAHFVTVSILAVAIGIVIESPGNITVIINIIGIPAVIIALIYHLWSADMYLMAHDIRPKRNIFAIIKHSIVLFLAYLAYIECSKGGGYSFHSERGFIIFMLASIAIKTIISVIFHISTIRGYYSLFSSNNNEWLDNDEWLDNNDGLDNNDYWLDCLTDNIYDAITNYKKQ